MLAGRNHSDVCITFFGGEGGGNSCEERACLARSANLAAKKKESEQEEGGGGEGSEGRGREEHSNLVFRRIPLDPISAVLDHH